MSTGFDELPLDDVAAGTAIFEDVQMEQQEPDLPFYLIRPPPGNLTLNLIKIEINHHFIFVFKSRKPLTVQQILSFTMTVNMHLNNIVVRKLKSHSQHFYRTFLEI